MAGFIAQETLTRVLEATDIVALVQQYVPLKRAGQTYKALCPFHNEKTPSFVVWPQRQTYKCFGCGAGGDAFSFVMAQEHCEFPEAVRLLASRAGVSLPETAASGHTREERTILEQLVAQAADFYAKALQTPAGQKARDYIAKRGIGEPSVRRWALGYSPEGWSNLLDQAREQGASLRMLEKAGLIVQGQQQGHYYDRFRGRLMFSISDVSGKPIGFGARCLDGSEPKYLNSPQTLLFDKSSCLYGLYQAKQAILHKRQVVIVEGYTDVIMAHQCGAENVVATLGTALTRQHIDLLRRYADEAVLVYDADTAGVKASDRSLEIFVERELLARIATLPAGQDPCDYCLGQGGEAFGKRIEEARSLFVYKTDQAAVMNSASPRERAAAADDLLRLVSLVPGAVERGIRLDEVVRQAALALKVDEGSLRRRFKELIRGSRPRAGGQPEAVQQPQTAPPPIEAELVALALSDADSMARLADEVEPGSLGDARLRSIYERAVQMHRDQGPVVESHLVAALSEAGLGAMVVDLITTSQQQGHYAERLEACLLRWRQQQARSRAQQIEQQMRQADAVGDTSRLSELHRQYLEVIRQA